MTRTKDAANNQPDAFAFFERLPDEDSAGEYFIGARWPNGVICPRCGHDQVCRIRNGTLFRCKHNSKRLNAGRGRVGKAAVLGMKQTGGDIVACPVENTDAETLSGSVNSRVTQASTVCSDEAGAYNQIKAKNNTVNHSSGEYALAKRSHYGIYHTWSPRHPHRCISEFTKRRTIRNIPAFDKSDGSGVAMIHWMMAGRTLTCRALTDG